MDFYQLQVFWFITLCILLAGYAILDGFDLGVGILHMLVRTDRERRLLLRAIGPVWDGNEVWLVTFGGALFAAFPAVYATIFSGFYVPFMLVLWMLILRAVSIEFRSKKTSRLWKNTWDCSFAVSSLCLSFLFGVTIGNLMIGFQIEQNHIMHTNLLELLSPFPILVGIFTISLFALHGSLYLNLKIEVAEDLHKRVQGWIWFLKFLVIILYLIILWNMMLMSPHWLNWATVSILLVAMLLFGISQQMICKNPLISFSCSACFIAGLVCLLGITLYPTLLMSRLTPELSLTITNASSSEATLRIMRNIAFLGMPFVLVYTGIIFWLFRGKVQFNDKDGY